MESSAIRATVRTVLLAASLALAGQIAWDTWQSRHPTYAGPACEIPKSD